MLPASRWFLLIAGAALAAMLALAFLGHRLELATPSGSPAALRLAAFMHASFLALALLFGFAIVPPAIRAILAVISRLQPRLACEPSTRPARAAPRPPVADMLALGIWAVFALGLVAATPPLLTMLGAD